VKGRRPWAGGLACAFLSTTATCADIPLYSTGPSEDSAFVRFVNALPGAAPLAVDAASTRVELGGLYSVSGYLPVQPGKSLEGTMNAQGQSVPLALGFSPGEFVTIIALPDAKAGLAQTTIRETPDDFNGLKASLAFFNADASCLDASLRPAGRNADIFNAVSLGSVQRRSINPVRLSVQLVCANSHAGSTLDLGELKAGERYSVFLLPGAKLLAITDSLTL
jgi:hypothetical protein